LAVHWRHIFGIIKSGANLLVYPRYQFAQEHVQLPIFQYVLETAGKR
jgi:hypothetical protein